MWIILSYIAGGSGSLNNHTLDLFKNQIHLTLSYKSNAHTSHSTASLLLHIYSRSISNTCVPEDLCKNILQALIRIIKSWKKPKSLMIRKEKVNCGITNIIDYCTALNNSYIQQHVDLGIILRKKKCEKTTHNNVMFIKFLQKQTYAITCLFKS